MNETKDILICCGTSMITSSVVVSRLKAALDKEGIPARFHQCKYSDIGVLVGSRHYDVVVPTGKVDPGIAKGVPVVLGVSFLTGIGMNDVVKQIVAILRPQPSPAQDAGHSSSK